LAGLLNKEGREMPVGNRGTYCVVIFCGNDIEITIGKLGQRRFLRGYYIYVGSALNDMDKRIKRHISRKKKIFWHIDYLTSNKDFSVHEIYIINGTKRIECQKAAEIRESLPSITGFGSSDCKCSSHLFYAGVETNSLNRAGALLSRVGFDKYKNHMDHPDNG
jgi:Uri superfamily endonuclease